MKVKRKMTVVASTAPGNVWTSDEFAILVRDAVAKLLDVRPDDLPTAARPKSPIQ
jgi:hypothetical protein